jgi:membrane-associated phospholipid phosphatase
VAHSEYSYSVNPQEPGEPPRQSFSGSPAQRIAYLVSLIFHPLLIPSLLFGLLLFYLPGIMPGFSLTGRLALWGVLCLTTFFIPLLSLISLRYFGNLRSLHMERRQDRPMPMIFVSLYYLLTTWLFFDKYPDFSTINGMLAGITLTLLFLTVISFFWKISAHSAATGGGVGFAIALVLRYSSLIPETLYVLSALLILTGLVMWARLYMRTHTLAESLAGWLLGVLLGLAALMGIWVWMG